MIDRKRWGRNLADSGMSRPPGKFVSGEDTSAGATLARRLEMMKIHISVLRAVREGGRPSEMPRAFTGREGGYVLGTILKSLADYCAKSKGKLPDGWGPPLEELRVLLDDPAVARTIADEDRDRIGRFLAKIGAKRG
jgi:hypothetical protein